MEFEGENLLQSKRDVALIRAKIGMVFQKPNPFPSMTIGEVLALTSAHRFSGVPVVEGDRLVGIVTSRDLRFETRFDQPVSAIMTPKERLVTVQEDASQADVKALLHKHRIEKVLVTNKDGQLKGLIPVKDIAKRQKLEKSLMPEGLAAGISVTDLASLVDYLESLAHGGK